MAGGWPMRKQGVLSLIPVAPQHISSVLMGAQGKWRGGKYSSWSLHPMCSDPALPILIGVSPL